MSEHKKWHNLFEAFVEYRNHLKTNQTEIVDIKKEPNHHKLKLQQMALIYFKEIKKYNQKTSLVVADVKKLMEELVPAIEKDSFNQITRCINEIGKIRHNIPERVGFFASLFGKKPQQVNQGAH